MDRRGNLTPHRRPEARVDQGTDKNYDRSVPVIPVTEILTLICVIASMPKPRAKRGGKQSFDSSRDCFGLRPRNDTSYKDRKNSFSFWNARPRWLRAFFCSSDISANVRLCPVPLRSTSSSFEGQVGQNCSERGDLSLEAPQGAKWEANKGAYP